MVLEYVSVTAEFDYFGKEESSSREFSLGLRYEVSALQSIRPYVEGGLSYAQGEVNLVGGNVDPGRIFDESAGGGWLAVGNTWLRENDVDYGFKIKKSVAKTTLPSGRRIDLGGTQYLFMIGFDL